MFKATREGEEAVPGHTHEQVVESTEQTQPKLDQMWPGTREWEVAVQAHTYEQVVESTELTQHKRTRCGQGQGRGRWHCRPTPMNSTELTQLKLDTEATRNVEKYKAEGTKHTRLKLDQMWPGTRE